MRKIILLSVQDFEGLIGPILLRDYPGRTLNPMSVQELKDALGPEATNLTITYAANGNQILHVGDKQIEVSPMASNDEIRAAIQNPTISTKNTKMSITGLQAGSFKAMLEEMKAEIAAAQNQGVADVKAAKDEAKAEITNTIATVKAKVKSEVSDALQEFAQFTNGGPA